MWLRCGTGLLSFFLFLLPVCAQQVQRASVAFENFFYEVGASEPHLKMFFSVGPQDEYDVEVFYETLDGTALAGRDYVATQGSFIIPAGSPVRTREIQVQILPRESAADRTFSVKLNASFPAEVSRTRGQVNVTIKDRPPLRIAIFDTNIVLGWRASATNFVLERSESFTSPLINEWTPVEGTPTPIQFDPGQTLILPLDTTNSFFRLRNPRDEPNLGE